MISISEKEVGQWRLEIERAEKFRSDNLGELSHNEISLSGENIDYFEMGISRRTLQQVNIGYPYTTINVVFPIVKNIIPTLYYRNPYIQCFPKRRREDDAQSAPLAAQILNHYHRELELKEVNKQIVFDAYVVGMGVCKIGYSTKFGVDIPDENEQKDRQEKKNRTLLEKVGLKKPKKEEEPDEDNVFTNEYVMSESPYVTWVNPFEFGIDPDAKDISEARYVFQKVTKFLDDVKGNKSYKNTKDLQGSPRNDGTVDNNEVALDFFKTVDLYEVHYKRGDGIYILTLAKDQSEFKALRHEKSIYNMDGFQFEVLYFNKHNHSLYPKSDVDIVKGLQDRINQTLENILDQVDKYCPKLFVDYTGLQKEGERALEEGDIGAIIKCNKNPNEVVREGSFTQVKADLFALIDKMLELIMLETGLTKAQLLGMTSAQTATEAQIGQAGQNLRIGDKFDAVSSFLNRQCRKLWQVIAQFVDLEEVALITGMDDGVYSWQTDIDSVMADKLAKGEYRFEIEMGSTEKPDLPIIRKQMENFFTILASKGVMDAFRAQGFEINLKEFLREYSDLFPHMFKNKEQMIIPAQQPMQQQGANLPQPSRTPENIADILAGAAGEKGQGVPIA